MVLWAMSVFAAGIILAAAGFGEGSFNQQGLSRWCVVVVGSSIWVLGWAAALMGPSGSRINWGFALITLASWGLLARAREPGWGGIALVLAVIASVVRLMAPFGFDQASVMPHAIIESIGLGGAAGFSVGQPWSAALVGAAAESSSAFLIPVIRGGHEDLGRHDLGMALIAALAAWLVGWSFAHITSRLERRTMA